MKHIIYCRVETQLLDDYDQYGKPIKKPGNKTLLLKNKHGDVLFCGEAPTINELLVRLPHSLRQELAERGLGVEIESAESRLARTARDFEEALAAFPPDSIQVNVYDSRERLEYTRLEEPIAAPRSRIEIFRNTTKQVYP